MTYSTEPLKIDVVLEEKILSEKKMSKGTYLRVPEDTIFTYLCVRYDTVGIYRAFDKLYPIFFKEQDLSPILHQRTFHIKELGLADSLLSLEINNKKINYTNYTKSLFPYKDDDGNEILMVSGYIRYEGTKYDMFPLVYDKGDDYFLAKINVSEKELIFIK